MFSNLHVLDTNIEFNLQYTRYLINSVLQNGLGSITLPTMYFPVLDKLLANSDSPVIRWEVYLSASSDPYELLDLFKRYTHLSLVIKPQTGFQLDRFKKCLGLMTDSQSAYFYVNCIDLSPKALGQYLDNICIHPNITPIVLINEDTTDSILYCKSAQKNCSVKFGLVQDWTFSSIEMANKCEIPVLMATDANIVHLLHK